MLGYSDPITGFGQDKLRPWGLPVVMRLGRNLRKEIRERTFLKLWGGGSHRKMSSIENFRVAWSKQEGEADVCNSVFNNSVPDIHMTDCRLSQSYRSVGAEHWLSPKWRLLWFVENVISGVLVIDRLLHIQLRTQMEHYFFVQVPPFVARVNFVVFYFLGFLKPH
jgi:hypothetical protein